VAGPSRTPEEARDRDPSVAKEKLLRLLRLYSYRYDPAGGFRLASGNLSHFYVDCKATTMRGEAMDLVGGLVAAALPPDVHAVGGMTMGADPIAQATAHYSSVRGRPLNAFSVRKEPKGHGLRKWIEGCADPGTAVAVVDDVVTTGGSTVDAIERCRADGLRVGAVVVLVDRQEGGGLDRVRQAAGPGVQVTAIFTLDEIRTPREEHPANLAG
jgi:orotate phosphoribosyltransferase